MTERGDSIIEATTAPAGGFGCALALAPTDLGLGQAALLLINP